MSWYKMSKKNVKYKFSSTQVDMPQEFATELMEWGKKNIANEDVYTDPKDPSLGRENEIHITLKYGLHSANSDEVVKLLRGESAIELKLGKISKFRGDDYDVLKIDIESDDMKRLNKVISDNVKVTDTFPDYRPHMTIAYVKKGTCNNLLKSKKFDGRKFLIDKIIFSSKQYGKSAIKLQSIKKRVFLGGTCAGSDWRDKLIKKLDVGFFDPVVDDWNEEAQKREIEERKTCDFVLYTITSDMKGVYSIAEVVDDSNKRPKKTVFCILKKGFDKGEFKSLEQVKKMVEENGGKAFDNLEDVAKYLNGQK